MAFSTTTLGVAVGALAVLGIAAVPAEACEFMRSADKTMSPVAAVQTTIGSDAAEVSDVRTEPAKTTVTQAAPAKPASVEPEAAELDVAKVAQPKTE